MNNPRASLTRCGAAMAMTAALMSSSLPSPLYATYQVQWGLSSLWISMLFAVYAIGVLASLILMSAIGDQIRDRRYALTGAACLTLVSALVMASADAPGSLLLGRVLSGLGTGTLMGAAGATLLELHPRRDIRAAAVHATIAFTAGAGLGPLISGYCLNADLHPTQLPYLAIALLALLAIPAIALTPVKITHTEKNQRNAADTADHNDYSAGRRFYLATAIMVQGWSVGSVFMASGQRFALELAQLNSVFIAAALISTFQCVAVVGQLLGGRIAQRPALFTGIVLAAAAQIGMAISALTSAALCFEICCVLAGLGYGLAFVGATGLINLISRPDNRARLLSRYYMFGYVFGNAMPALAVGAMTDGFSLAFSLAGFSGWIFVLSVVILIALHHSHLDSAGTRMHT